MITYDSTGNFHEGLARFKKDEKYGFIDKTGKEVIKVKYEEVGSFHEGLAWFYKNGKYGFTDKTGKEVIKAKYEEVRNFHEGLAYVKKDGKSCYIDKTGKEVIKVKYENVGDFHEGLAWFEEDENYGFMDKTGKKVTEAKYQDVGDFHEGLAWFEEDGKYGFIDKTGKEVIEAKYNSLEDFHEGLAYFLKFEKSDHIFGFIDKNGNLYQANEVESLYVDNDMAIFDNKYLTKIKDLEKIFVCLATINGKEFKKEFKTQEKRDEYYNCLNAYIDGRTTRKEADINDKKREIEPLIKKLNEDILLIENNYYEDIVNEINNSYQIHS